MPLEKRGHAGNLKNIKPILSLILISRGETKSMQYHIQYSERLHNLIFSYMWFNLFDSVLGYRWLHYNNSYVELSC